MGIAASSARYLMLLARQSDVEFEGQQIQQSILDLSKQSSQLFRQQLDMKAPTAPMESDYTVVEYTFQYNIDGSYETHRIKEFKPIAEESYNYSILCDIKEDGADQDYNWKEANLTVNASGRITKINSIKDLGDNPDNYSNLQVQSHVDTDAYNDALQEYRYAQIQYDKAYADIQTQLSLINSQDKMLEMQLNQLDTERTALKTEVETLQKLVKENVERSFKTFGN